MTSLKLGQVVHVRTSTKGAGAAHVVVGITLHGAMLCYCGAKRWYKARAFSREHIVTDLDDNENVRRARRWLAKVEPDADGWLRIAVGRTPTVHVERIGHVELSR